MVSESQRRRIRTLLEAEEGRIEKDAPLRVALTYPSPYAVAMSSLGYQQIYRILQATDGVCCERVMLPDGGDQTGAEIEVPVSLEGLRPLSAFPVVACSVAYELELAGLVRMLDRSGIPYDRSERDDSFPLLIAGGPLTFSNPLPLGHVFDAVVLGEAEETFPRVLDAVRAGDRAAQLRALADLPHVYVPIHHGNQLPTLGQSADELLPARSIIITPNTELSRMFLVEAERGCSRGCRYCVMRRSTNGGMRILPAERVLATIPETAQKVGLVGAAVSDHPQILTIVRALTERGLGVGLSSLRPDKLTGEFIATLKAAGYRTITTALDGASERMRGVIDRRGREPHYLRAAEECRAAGMERLKLYLMVGIPGETDEDIDECAAFVTGLSRIIPISLGISPFCAKHNTPLDGTPYAGVKVVERRLDRLRKGLRGRADVRAASARWAWVEYVLAQGGHAEAAAVATAVRAGGGYADYRKAFAPLGWEPDARVPLHLPVTA